MRNRLVPATLAAALLLGACSTIPNGPSELALPGSTRTFEQFRFDDADCRQFSLAQVGGTTPGEAATESTAKSAALGAGIGAVAGAAVSGGRGAGAGAGLGLIVGAIAGADAGDRSSWALQQRYDAAYKQCMYARGHKIPVYGNVNYTTAPARAPTALTPPPPPAPR